MFRVSLRKEFGEVSLEGDDEKEIIKNLKRLQALGKKVDKTFGTTIKIPDDAINKLANLTNIQKILVLLSYSPKPLTRKECKSWTKELQIPAGWWIGSNFSRDLKKLSSGIVDIVNSDSTPRYRITRKGKMFVKNMISGKSTPRKTKNAKIPEVA